MMRIIVFGHNDWWVWQRQGFCTRNAALVRELATRDEVSGLLIVDSPRWRTRTHRPASARREAVSAVGPKTLAVRYSYSLPLPSGRSTGWSLNERLASPSLVRRLAGTSRSGDEPTVLWVADPRLVETALRVPHDAFVFDAIDDWRHHGWAGEATVNRGYRLAARHADVMFAVHPMLLELFQPDGHGEALFNAVNASAWADVAPSDVVAGRSGLLVGYAGTIQHRVDAALLTATTRLLPDMRFMLVGRVYPGYRHELGGLGANVWFAGPRPYQDLPGLIAACDVCIVPHLRDGLTATMDPLKLYEYAAAAKPVVSTVSSPNPAIAGQATIALGVDAFVEAIAAEVRLDDTARRVTRRRSVEHETWPRRVDRVLQVLEAAAHGLGIPP
jgi:glycosyltransferase involved in cell wall biosynthesis